MASAGRGTGRGVCEGVGKGVSPLFPAPVSLPLVPRRTSMTLHTVLRSLYLAFMAVITTSEKSMFVWWVNPSLCRVRAFAQRQHFGRSTRSLEYCRIVLFGIHPHFESGFPFDRYGFAIPVRFDTETGIVVYIYLYGTAVCGAMSTSFSNNNGLLRQSLRY